MSAECVSAVLTDHTRCVVVAHQFGNVAPTMAIREVLAARSIPIIDDAAQAFGCSTGGRPAGSGGEFGMVASGPQKPLAGIAGGVLLTNDGDAYRRVCALLTAKESSGKTLGRIASFCMWQLWRRHTLPLAALLAQFGRTGAPEEVVLSPMTNVEAAINLRQLARLDESVKCRRENARSILAALPQLLPYCVSDIPGGMVTVLAFVLPPVPGLADRLRLALAADGIEAQRPPLPCHLKDPEPRPYLRNTEELYRRVLLIPVESTVPSLPNTARLLDSGVLGSCPADNSVFCGQPADS
jgi:dTDP-4-amino-4,6-dideoxygalactose transaminase